MKVSIVGCLLSVAVVVLLVLSCFVAFVSAQAVVTAAQVNGTWKSKNGTFKVLALGNQKLKVEFLGIYKYKSPKGPTANFGEGSGVAVIEADTAIFRPEDAEKDCTITMKFTEGKLVVEQEGFCGFGFRVTTGGTYQRASKQKPKFED